MDERERLRQTSMRFASEVERIKGGNWVNMPVPLVLLIDALESEPLINEHLASCMASLPAEGFDAAGEVDRVLAQDEACFGPFGVDDPSSTAQAYLIVQELVQRDYKFDNPFFAGYGPEQPRHQDRFARFVDDLVTPLIASVEGKLQRMREELGPDPAAKEPDAPEDTAVEDSADEDDVTPERIEKLIDQLRDATATLVPADREDALLQIEALRDEVLCPEPKARVVTVLLRVLGTIGGKGPFAQALERLEEALERFLQG